MARRLGVSSGIPSFYIHHARNAKKHLDNQTDSISLAPMVRHHEIRLTSAKLLATEILRNVISFSRETKGWEAHPSGLHENGKCIGPYCLVVHKDIINADIALVADEKDRRAVNVTNIVFRDIDDLSVELYNEIGERLATDLGQFVRRRKLDLKVRLKRFHLSLETAIPSPRCREFFEIYLQGFPRSFHPGDNQALDRFICAIHRFHGKVNVHALMAHLVEQCLWPDQDALLVGERIRVGLTLLKANRRF